MLQVVFILHSSCPPAKRLAIKLRLLISPSAGVQLASNGCSCRSSNQSSAFSSFSMEQTKAFEQHEKLQLQIVPRCFEVESGWTKIIADFNTYNPELPWYKKYHMRVISVKENIRQQCLGIWFRIVKNLVVHTEIIPKHTRTVAAANLHFTTPEWSCQ